MSYIVYSRMLIWKVLTPVDFVKQFADLSFAPLLKNFFPVSYLIYRGSISSFKRRERMLAVRARKECYREANKNLQSRDRLHKMRINKISSLERINWDESALQGSTKKFAFDFWLFFAEFIKRKLRKEQSNCAPWNPLFLFGNFC